VIKNYSINTFDDYQHAAHATAVYPAGLMYYPVLGLVGEAGELYVACTNWRDGGYDIIKEAGDVLWYCAEICTSHGRRLQECYMGELIGPMTMRSVQPMFMASKIAELYKKAIRSGAEAPEFKNLIPAISTILIVINNIASDYDLRIYDIMERNLEKLSARAADGELKERKNS